MIDDVRTGLDRSVNHHGGRRRVQLLRLQATKGGRRLLVQCESLDKRGQENSHQCKQKDLAVHVTSNVP